MAYKTGYQPAQGLIDGVWQPLGKESRSPQKIAITKDP